eukprot:g1428.t1
MGCMDTEACNYDDTATVSDGWCFYENQLDHAYYDCATKSCVNDVDNDGVCDELEIRGCTDEQACNYLDHATEDDGSCDYGDLYDCDTGECTSGRTNVRAKHDVNFEVSLLNDFISDISWSVLSCDGERVYAQGGAPSNVCVDLTDVDDVQIIMRDSDRNGWHGNVLTVGDDIVGGGPMFGDTELTIPCGTDAMVSTNCSDIQTSEYHHDTYFDDQVSWMILTCEGVPIVSGGAPFDACVRIPESFVIVTGDNFDDGWRGNSLRISQDGRDVYETNGPVSAFKVESVECEIGCRDPSACNYNPHSTYDHWTFGVHVVRGPEHLFVLDYPFTWGHHYGTWTSPHITEASISGTLMLVNDGTVYPHRGCSEIQIDMSDRIAVAKRGGCSFSQKALRAQDAGAVGLIVVNYANFLVHMIGVSEGVNIPTLFVSNATGHHFLAAIEDGFDVDIVLGRKENSCQYVDEDGDGVCDHFIQGCTNTTSCNFDPDATYDDGSCEFPPSPLLDCDGECVRDADGDGVCDELEISGCTNATSCTFDPNATDDDGSCEFPPSPLLDCDGECLHDLDNDGVCDELEIAGCTNATSCTFEPTATDDDGSCVYPTDPLLDCDGECLHDLDNDGVCDELEIAGCTNATSCTFDPSATHDDGSCVYPTDPLLDCDGDCLHDADDDGVCDENEISGCTNETSCTYDPMATDDDGSCKFPRYPILDCDGTLDVQSSSDDVVDSASSKFSIGMVIIAILSVLVAGIILFSIYTFALLMTLLQPLVSPMGPEGQIYLLVNAQEKQKKATTVRYVNEKETEEKGGGEGEAKVNEAKRRPPRRSLQTQIHLMYELVPCDPPSPRRKGPKSLFLSCEVTNSLTFDDFVGKREESEGDPLLPGRTETDDDVADILCSLEHQAQCFERLHAVQRRSMRLRVETDEKDVDPFTMHFSAASSTPAEELRRNSKRMCKRSERRRHLLSRQRSGLGNDGSGVLCGCSAGDGCTIA